MIWTAQFMDAVVADVRANMADKPEFAHAASIAARLLMEELHAALPDADARVVGVAMLVAAGIAGALVESGCDDPALVVNMLAVAGADVYEGVADNP